MWLREELQGSSALLIRALNEDVRTLAIQFNRGMFVAAGLWVAIIAFGNQFYSSAPGLAMFQNILMADTLLLFFIVIPYFSGAITEEREQGTLGLLKMSGISPLGLLLGKSMSRFLGVCLALILQIPFVMLAVTFGGITNTQIIAAIAGLLAFLFLVNNVCLFASLCRPTLKDATAVAKTALFLWYILPRMLYIPIALILGLGKFTPIFATVGNVLTTALNWYLNTQLFSRLTTITSSTFSGSWLSSQVILDLLLGALFFYVSWRRFESLTIDTEPVVQERKKKKSAFVLSPPSIKRKVAAEAVVGKPSPEILTVREADQCWNNPFLWKEFQFRCGGWSGLRWQWLKFLMGYAALLGLMVLGFLLTLIQEATRAGTTAGFNASGFFTRLWGSITFLGGIILWISSLIMFRLLLAAFYDSFTEELQHKTYSTLLLTPNNARRIAVSTVLGRLFTLLPGLIWVLTGLLIFIIGSILTSPISRGFTIAATNSAFDWIGTARVLLFLACIFSAFCTFLPWLFYLGLWSQSLLSNTGKWALTVFLVQCQVATLVFMAECFDWGWQTFGVLMGFIFLLFQAGLAYLLYVRIPRLMQIRMGD